MREGRRGWEEFLLCFEILALKLFYTRVVLAFCSRGTKNGLSFVLWDIVSCCLVNCTGVLNKISIFAARKCSLGLRQF